MFYLRIYLFVYGSDMITLKLLHTSCVKKQTSYIYSLMQCKVPQSWLCLYRLTQPDELWPTSHLDVAMCSYIVYLLDDYDSDSYVANVIRKGRKPLQKTQNNLPNIRQLESHAWLRFSHLQTYRAADWLKFCNNITKLEIMIFQHLWNPSEVTTWSRILSWRWRKESTRIEGRCDMLDKQPHFLTC
jgi:hypothetical protein